MGISKEDLYFCEEHITIKDSFIIGLAQACACLPGLSRSGSTIATGLILGDNKQKLAQFSFLMVIPPILGEALLDVIKIMKNGVDVGSMNNVSILSLYFNSITLAVGETLVGMAMCCMAAYILAKYEFKGRKIIYSIVLISTFVPAIATLPAIYNLYTNPNYPIKLDGTYIGMIILNAGAFGGSFLYVHSYFKMVPWSFAESAMMDGASDFRVFVQIMLPLAKNGVITFTILKFLGYWNDYWYPSLFYKNRPTLSVAIAELTNTSSPKIPLISAAMVLAIVPVLIFYAITQKRLLSNAFDGGLK